MTITSKGYEGTVDYADWALIMSHAGAQYSVVGADDFKASVGPGDRVVNIAAGTAYGQGILDESDSTVALAGAPVASGNRWDILVLRRDWSTNESALVLITSDQAYDPIDEVFPIESGPGILDDQPLWLVRFAAGQSAPQEFIDLRLWHGDGGVVARSIQARYYVERIGTRIWVNGIAYILGFASNGTVQWRPDSVYVGSTQPPYMDGLGWIKVP